MRSRAVTSRPPGGWRRRRRAAPSTSGPADRTKMSCHGPWPPPSDCWSSAGPSQARVRSMSSWWAATTSSVGDSESRMPSIWALLSLITRSSSWTASALSPSTMARSLRRSTMRSRILLELSSRATISSSLSDRVLAESVGLVDQRVELLVAVVDGLPDPTDAGDEVVDGGRLAVGDVGEVDEEGVELLGVEFLDALGGDPGQLEQVERHLGALERHDPLLAWAGRPSSCRRRPGR